MMAVKSVLPWQFNVEPRMSFIFNMAYCSLIQVAGSLEEVAGRQAVAVSTLAYDQETIQASRVVAAVTEAGAGTVQALS